MANFEYSDWIKHDGLGVPVLSETLVLIHRQDDDPEDIETPETFEEDFRMGNSCGLLDTYQAKYWGPHWYSSDANPIIAYRVMTPLT